MWISIVYSGKDQSIIPFTPAEDLKKVLLVKRLSSLKMDLATYIQILDKTVCISHKS